MAPESAETRREETESFPGIESPERWTDVSRKPIFGRIGSPVTGAMLGQTMRMRSLAEAIAFLRKEARQLHRVRQAEAHFVKDGLNDKLRIRKERMSNRLAVLVIKVP